MNNSKKSRSEANRVAEAIKKTKTNFYISDVDLDDNVEDVFACVTSIRKTLGKNNASFLVISAGVKNLIVVADVMNENISAKQFLLKSMENISTELTEDSTDRLAKCVIEIDTPFKLKDIVRGSGFQYLRNIGQLQEESDDEDFYEF